MRTAVLCGMMIAAFVHGQEQPADEQDPRLIIEKLRTEYLIRELELDPELAVQFAARLSELQAIESEFRREQGVIIEELRKLLEQGAADKRITDALSRHENIMRKRAEDQMAKMKEIHLLLSPVQRAKFLIAAEEFAHEIREMIREVKRRRPGSDE